MKLSFLIFLFAVATAVNNLHAQSYSYVRYDTKDGLASATVYDISQDTKGFLWFGTENGLCRFDGKNFRTYTTRDGMPDNSILKVHGDNTGKVYFTPFTRGLAYYRNDSIFTVSIPPKYKVDLSVIESLFSKGPDLLLSGTIECYILDSNGIQSLADHYHNTRHDRYIRIYDTLVIAEYNDSLYFNTDHNKARSISFKPDQYVGFAFDDSMNLAHLDIGKRSSFVPKGYLRNNLIWDYSGNFLVLYDNRTGKLLYRIPIEKVSSAFIDTENNLWVGTLGNGVYRFSSFDFRTIDFGGKNEVFSIAMYSDKIFAGTDFSKMYAIKLTGNDQDYEMKDFSFFNGGSDNPITRMTNRNRIYTLYSDDMDLYIGADAFLLRQTGSSAPVFRNIHPVKDIDIRDNKVMVCTGWNVLLLDKATLRVTDTVWKQRATSGVIYHGDYYIGTLGGLLKINGTTGAISPLHDSLPSLTSRITAIRRGVDDDLWIATSGYGLLRLKNDRIIQTIVEKDGLTSDICTCLFIDGNVAWLGTNNGLNRIDLSQDRPSVTRFTSANGLGADFINSIFATDSMVYVGTAAGLSSFKKDILTEKSICILHVLGVSENNRKLKADSVYTFSYNAMNIQIDFTAISFKSAGDITYSYRLPVLSDSWNTTTANFVNFSTLPPGDYDLLLKATNKFGVVSDTRIIKIKIQPPWWQTWLFRGIALLSIGLIILLIYRFNVRNIKRKEKTKREIEARFAALEQQALQAQMNPHFIFNCLNSIQTFILNFDAEGANSYLTTFASLIRQTLDNSIQSLIPVASELKYLETYLDLEKLRFREKFRYVIYVDEEIDISNTMLPGMLLQPYVENSLRHGIQLRKDNNGLISVSVKKTEDHGLLYTIRDNGVGRRKAGEMRSSRHIEYQSRGTSINEKRIAAINNQYNTHIWVKTTDIIDEKEMVAGTLVSVYIPPFHK